MSGERREPTWDERILAAIPSGVDETLIAENLRLTPTERVEKLQRMLDQLAARSARRGHRHRRLP